MTEAIEKYWDLQHDRTNPETWCSLGMLYYKQGQYEYALEMLYTSLSLAPSSAAHYNLGLILEQIGYFPQAIQAYRDAIALNPSWIEAYNRLGQLLARVGEWEQAESVYLEAIQAAPNNYITYLNFGNLLMARQQIDRAIEIYQIGLQLNFNNSDILYNLGTAFTAKNEPKRGAIYFGYAAYSQGEYKEAIEQFKNFLETETGNVNLYVALADCYNHEEIEAAIDTCFKGIGLYPTATELYLRLMLALQNSGRLEEAIEVANAALILLPNELSIQLEEKRILPILYQDRNEIKFYRRRFVRGLFNLIQSTSVESDEFRENALKALSWQTNFYLQYQGYNDLELQKVYGEFVHRVMAANYPQWVNTPPVPPLSQDGKIRIGYISDCLHWHTVGMVFLGWLKNCDRQQFHISCYYTNRRLDQITEQFQLYSDAFYHIYDNLESACEQIRADELHILVFLDIGMNPKMTQLAGLRLAPIQCTAWGHPVTSGSPTIDYFLSGDLMEPENARSHYSEQLIRLPNIGICYPKPAIPESIKTRVDFGLRDNAVVYLSCQSLFKYLPQYDYIFATIAGRVPEAQFVFVSHNSSQITEQFRQRIARNFTKFGLKSEDYCIILPRLSHSEYLNLNLVSDIFLDTFGFTGFLTTLDSVACSLPVVSWMGGLMRSRQSAGILKRLGVTATIAKNESEYIKIAVRLGLDSQWRHKIVKKMRQGHQYLYDDRTCVAALEAFYRHVVLCKP